MPLAHPLNNAPVFKGSPYNFFIISSHTACPATDTPGADRSGTIKTYPTQTKILLLMSQQCWPNIKKEKRKPLVMFFCASEKKDGHMAHVSQQTQAQRESGTLRAATLTTSSHARLSLYESPMTCTRGAFGDCSASLLRVNQVSDVGDVSGRVSARRAGAYVCTAVILGTVALST